MKLATRTKRAGICQNSGEVFHDRNVCSLPEQGSIGSEFLHSRWGQAHLMLFRFKERFGKAEERRKHILDSATRVLGFVEKNLLLREAAVEGQAPRPLVVLSPDLPLPSGIENDDPNRTCFGVILMPEAVRTHCHDVGREIAGQQRRIFGDGSCTVHSVLREKEGGKMVAAMLRAMSDDFPDAAIVPRATSLVSAYHDEDDLMLAYDNWMRRLIARDGVRAFLLTYMFKRLFGGRDAVREQMWKEITYSYGRLLIRTHKQPGRPASQKHHPRLIAAPDFPVLKKVGVKLGLDDVSINDGLHYHGILLMPAVTRLSRDVDIDIRLDQGHYLGHHGVLKRIHAVAVTDTHRDVVGYALKDLRNSAFRGEYSADDILLLPKSRSELTPRAEMRHSRRMRETA